MALIVTRHSRVRFAERIKNIHFGSLEPEEKQQIDNILINCIKYGKLMQRLKNLKSLDILKK